MTAGHQLWPNKVEMLNGGEQIKSIRQHRAEGEAH